MIRMAELRDVSKIKELMQSEEGFWKVKWPEDVVHKALAAADGLAFVWDDDGEIIGFVCAHDFGFRSYLSELIVLKSHRGKGIGRGLVEHVQNQLKDRGCLILISDVWKDAEEFYRSLGWSQPDAVFLRKVL